MGNILIGSENSPFSQWGEFSVTNTRLQICGWVDYKVITESFENIGKIGLALIVLDVYNLGSNLDASNFNFHPFVVDVVPVL